MSTSRDIVDRLGGCAELTRRLNDCLPEGWRPVSSAAVRMWAGRGIPGKYHLLLLDLARRFDLPLTAEELLSTKRNMHAHPVATYGGSERKRNKNKAQGAGHVE